MTFSPVASALCRPAECSGCNSSALQSQDWQAQIRERATAGDLAAAREIAEQRLREAPQDLEARGWRARILGWMGQWKESEEEYRRVLERVPNDTDILIGLAGVLNALQRSEEALALLDQAQAVDPKRPDLHVTRGRTLRALGRRGEAREAFRHALALEPGSAEAKQGLDSVQEEPRHQLTIGADFDQFNFSSQDAQAYSLAFRSDLGARWSSLLAGRFDYRAGTYAGRWTGALTARLSRRDALTVGGSAGRDNGIVSKGEAFFEYGHGFTFGREHFLRGVEANYQQKWLWFDAARVLTLTPSALFYFPKDWTWSVAVTSARGSFPGVGTEWRPSGVTRLAFPIERRVSGNVFFAVGTENYALVDQIGRFSAQTYGGGLRLELPQRQQISGYFAYQNRTQGRTQKSVGFAYAVRF
jgi:tetratricopeptide (TPR) repeat protein